MTQDPTAPQHAAPRPDDALIHAARRMLDSAIAAEGFVEAAGWLGAATTLLRALQLFRAIAPAEESDDSFAHRRAALARRLHALLSRPDHADDDAR